jgi:hypothetical protein
LIPYCPRLGTTSILVLAVLPLLLCFSSLLCTLLVLTSSSSICLFVVRLCLYHHQLCSPSHHHQAHLARRDPCPFPLLLPCSHCLGTRNEGHCISSPVC